MPSDNDGTKPAEQTYTEASGEVGYLLFDSLVHHLFEKGVLTKNDALSVVQTAAQVVRGRMEEGDVSSPQTSAAMSILERTYCSFEALSERTGASQLDGHNIHALRPPLHGDRPKFPSDD